MGKVILEGFQCERCKHIWVPRNKDETPTICPKCKSPYWDKPRKSTLKDQLMKEDWSRIKKDFKGDL